jgi:hypothetical protein
MIRFALSGLAALAIVSCGKSNPSAVGNGANAGLSTLSCGVGFHSPGSEEEKTPTQAHLKQTGAIVNGEGFVQTPKFETGGSRLRYAASRTADGHMSLVVECGNSGQRQSFAGSGTKIVANVMCAEIPMPDYMYFASTEERSAADFKDRDWNSSPAVKSILVTCETK